jgi:polygalacturonase
VFEVRAYGAAGNGTTDDTAAIQAALAAARAAGGGTVHLPAGVYIISKWLVYDSNTQLVGDSASTVTIRNTTNRTNGTLMLRPNGYDRRNVLVRGITWDQRGDVYDANGDSMSEPAVDISNTSDVTVTQNDLRNIRTVGIYADATVLHPSTNMKINGNHVYQAGGDGISIFGKFTGVEINNNTVEHCEDDAIAIQDHGSSTEFPSQVVISGNLVKDCVTRTSYGSTPNGINVWGGDHVLVADNVIDRVFTSGLRLGVGAGRRGTDIEARNNTVTGAGTNNDTSDVPGEGIFVIGADRVQLTGNTVTGTNPRHMDLRILDSTSVTVS